MSTTQEVEQTPKTKHRNGFVRFVCDDHRYVFLGTTIVALIGMWFSMQPRSGMSFLKDVYALEVAMYYLLLAWVVVALVAFVNKLVRWHDYAKTSPFVRPAAKRVERVFSYVVWVVSAVLFVDRAVMGFASIVSQSIKSETNPQGFLEGMVYMMYEGRDIYYRGVITTIELAIFGTLIAFVLALLLVFLRLQKIDRPDNDCVRFFKVIGCDFAKVYSAVVRGTPMMVQSLLIYFAGFAAFRSAGMTTTEITKVWTTFVAGLVTISLNSTAYMMEVLRGGIEAVDPGQTEAARSLGLSQWQAMSKVVFPQGIKNAIPALSNELVINIKDSSVLSVIGVFDLMFATTTIAGIYYRQLEIYVVATLTYLVLTMIASKLLSMFAAHLDAPKVGPVLSSSDVTVATGIAGKADPTKVNGGVVGDNRNGR